jgi:transmembrane sensor
MNTETYNQAARWLVQLHADGEPQWDDPALCNWLAQDEHHALAFATVSAEWFAVAELAPTASVVRLSDRRVRTDRSRMRAWALAASLVLSVGLWLGYPQIQGQWAGLQHDLVAGQGEILSHQLADGSQLLLAPGSVVDIKYGDAQRGVELVRGQAFFDVVRVVDRPFTVQIEAGLVEVLGTAFGVQSDGSSAKVGVIRGRVRVSGQDQSSSLMLSAGEGAAIDDGQVHSAEVVGSFSWSSGQLAFDQQPVAQVLTRLASFSQARVLILARLDDQPVSAVIKTDRIEQGIESVADQAGLSVTRLPGLIVIH